MVRAADEKSTEFYIGLAACSVIGAVLVYHDFGVIAFIMLVFVGIWGFGLRDKFSNETTASAYSVFNKDGRAIVGGFTASQFENQLRGPLARNTNHSSDPLNGPIAESKQGTAGKGSGSANLSDDERRARRRAAAEAAERRLSAKEE
mmetsp:Transcript_10241/g.21508  ORF Transcript_10241/g.21508 Transcript_10241/m.21508 type:complete len:147 (-) Transcript_10241:1835-2275(-)